MIKNLCLKYSKNVNDFHYFLFKSQTKCNTFQIVLKKTTTDIHFNVYVQYSIDKGCEHAFKRSDTYSIMMNLFKFYWFYNFICPQRAQ